MFLDSTFGRVVWAGAEDVVAALDAIARGYATISPIANVKVAERGLGRARVRLQGVSWFLDCHHVGLFEAILRAYHVQGSVALRLDSPSDGDFLLTWTGEGGHG